ncbi:RNA-directed DNA polymerase, eukaryota, reverse transcriptase zinc-binding domain protein [Tanacetum coccineum]
MTPLWMERIMWLTCEVNHLKCGSFNFKKIGAKWGTLLDVENKEDGNYHSKRLCIHTKGITNVFESFKIVYKGKVYWVRAKKVSGWIPDFELTDEDGSESDESQSDDGLQEGVIGDEEDKQGEDDVSVVPDSMADKVNDNDGEDIEQNEAVDKNSTDPFGFYSLLRKNKQKDNHESSCKESLKFPPGFTPREEGECDDSVFETNGYGEVNSSVRRKKTKLSGTESVGSGHFQQSEIPRSGGSLLNVMDELIRVGQTMGYKMEGCIKNVEEIVERQGVDEVDFLSLQETKMEDINLFDIKKCWGNFVFDYVFSESNGFSGGEVPIFSSNAMVNLMQKLKFTKNKIRTWNRTRQSITNRKRALQKELGKLDMIIDNGKATEENLLHRMEVCNSIQELDKLHNMEVAQKAKVKWAVEGDENSKFYHGILNKKRHQLAIRGVMKDGVWEEKPDVVKKEFVNHFRARFEQPSHERPIINMEFPNQLNSFQVADLEAEVSIEEIKKAVWDCGTDKAPGPDGFTFGFYKRYWGLIESDVVAAVKYFFQTGTFYKGCNSSFISLIPKIPDAKLVKDFRPISLIGSLYKIITKILANRIMLVLGNLVNEVQSAFMADRQILDGPFILNEVYQWCKDKKKQSFILKVDFEKAYDSVRWDYLHDGSNKEILLRLSFSSWSWRVFISLSIEWWKQACFKFFKWGGDDFYEKPIWVKWCKVLASKDKGGLGVSSLFALNRALLIKWVWRFKTQNNLLWTRVIKAIHGDKGRFGIGSKKKIGNGKDTSFWDDVWIGEIPLKFRFPRLYNLETNKHADVASKLIQVHFSNLLGRCPRGGVEHQFQMGELTTLLNDVVLGDMDDRWRWTLDGSGDFSVASVRRALDDIRLPCVSTQTRWIKEVPIKVKILAWKVRLDCLPSRLNLSHRGLPIPSILCPMCGIAVESTSHIFFGCSVSSDIFRKICSWWNVGYSDLSSFEDWENWLNNIRLLSQTKKLLEGICFVFWWHLWTYRNKLLFGVDHPLIADIFDSVVSSSYSWCRSRCTRSIRWDDWYKTPYLISL